MHSLWRYITFVRRAECPANEFVFLSRVWFVLAARQPAKVLTDEMLEETYILPSLSEVAIRHFDAFMFFSSACFINFIYVKLAQQLSLV